MFVGEVQEFARELADEKIVAPHRVQVPAFDPATGEMELREADALLRYPSNDKPSFEIRTRYGRSIRVTGDHSVFRRSAEGLPEAIPVSDLKVSDDIALPAKLPVVERDWARLNVAQWLIESAQSKTEAQGELDLWQWSLHAPAVKDVLLKERVWIENWLSQSSRFANNANRRNAAGCAFRKYLHQGFVPLCLVRELQKRGVWQWASQRTNSFVYGGQQNLHAQRN